MPGQYRALLLRFSGSGKRQLEDFVLSYLTRSAYGIPENATAIRPSRPVFTSVNDDGSSRWAKKAGSG